jgi:4-hydroxybutyrate CoA-transferase
MKIGIKYCGGCNPTFNRREFVEKLIDEFENVYIAPADEEKVYDIVLIVCGCLNACVSHTNLNGRHKVIVSSVNDYVSAKDAIESCCSEAGKNK